MKPDDAAQVAKLRQTIQQTFPQQHLNKEKLAQQLTEDEEKLELLTKQMKATKKDIFYWLHLMG